MGLPSWKSGEELDLKTFLTHVLPEGIGIYSARIIPAGGGWHLEVQLDGLNDPDGSVSVDTCTLCSQKFVELIDATIESGKGDENPLPETMEQENYSMEVSSAGVERRLHLPEDLVRFNGKPLKLKYQKNETILSDLVVYKGKEENSGEFLFEIYRPKRNRDRAKQPGRSKQAVLRLELSDIIEGNLFLDY